MAIIIWIIWTSIHIFVVFIIFWQVNFLQLYHITRFLKNVTTSLTESLKAFCWQEIFEKQIWSNILGSGVLASNYNFDKSHYHSKTSCMWKLLPTLPQSPSDVCKVVSLSLFYCYFYCKGLEVLQSLVLPVQTFTSRTHHATLKELTHPHFLSVSNIRRKFHWNRVFFFCQNYYFM